VMNDIALYGNTGTFHPADDVPALQTAFEEIVEAAMSCVFTVVWADVPDSLPEPPYTTVLKACDRVIVIGRDADDNETELLYSPGCEQDSPSTPAWYWDGVNLPVGQLDDLPLDQCTEIFLCADACGKLKKQEWIEFHAVFGGDP
jgi:hypothetical protein